MDLQKWLAFLYLCSMMTLLAIAQPDLRYCDCVQSGNYTQNSTYQRNLNTLLSSLPSKLDEYGFCNASMGETPDRVSVVGLCRGDVEPDICQSCIKNAARETVQLCPNQKEVFGGYDECLIHYSNVSTVGRWSRSPWMYMWNLQNASSPDQFYRDLSKLLDSLGDRAANGFSLRKFAAVVDEMSSLDDISIMESLQYNFDIIKTATDNFSDSNKLGQGGFGPVYKGKLPNGLQLAVKRLSVNSRQGDQEFKNEVLLVAKLEHRNLAWTQWREGTAMNLVDPFLKGKSGSVPEMMRCIHLALLCVQENVADRPTMSTVVLMLSGFSMSLPVPSSPPFFMHSTISNEVLLLPETAAYSSQNEASITELYPR
nr:putative receptor-like protein kinase At4g00960 [Ipomoea batatas]